MLKTNSILTVSQIIGLGCYTYRYAFFFHIHIFGYMTCTFTNLMKLEWKFYIAEFTVIRMC